LKRASTRRVKKINLNFFHDFALGNDDLANKSCGEIGKMKVFQLAVKLQEIFPDELDSQAMPVAREFLQTIRDLELVEDEVAVQTPVQSTQPLEVKVQLQKSIGEMALSELLTHLSDNPAQYEEIAPYIEANPVIKKVLPKTLSYAILVAGKLNVELTLAYITLLSKVHSKPQRQFQGHRPVTLEAALGLRSRPVVHPLTGEPVEGPDEAGFDYSAISEELHIALIWAKQTKHAFWPTGGMDIFTFGSEVTSETLPRRWQGILEDYQQARTAGEPSTEGLTRYWTQQKEVNAVAGEIRNLLNNIGVVRTPSGVRSEADYKALLEQSSAGDRKFSQSNATVQGRIYDSMDVTGTNARISGPICLGRANVAATNASGMFYIPRGNGRLVTLSGTNCSADYEEKSYEQLARIAGLI
jgi:hypothetical protein